MKMRFLLATLALAALPFVGFTQPYKDKTLPINARVSDLLGRMTLKEKVAQTQCLWQQKKFILDDKGNFDAKKAESILKSGMGEIARPSEIKGSVSTSRSPKETVELANAIQKYFVEKTRLGIPVIFHEESLHGNQAKDATNFPSHLALSCTWDEALFSEIYNAVALEVRARGAQHVLAPVVDLCRDPRWGRSEETLGEDPYLASRLAVSSVKAYQGESEKIGDTKVAATLKHFAAHGQPEAGVNIAPVSTDIKTLREVFFPPFKAAVMEAKVCGVMPTYNELNATPAHANSFLLKDVLRKEWGFDGVVVSDYMAVEELRTIHKLTAEKDTLATAELAFESGVDMETPDMANFLKLEELAAKGKISEQELNETVRRILTLKFRLGLFDNPYADAARAEKVIGSIEHRKIALKSAQKSIVLLKNEADILPLNTTKYKKIAYIGPNANRCILGGYSNMPKQLVTPFGAAKEAYGSQATITYAEGVRLTDKGDWFSDTVKLSSPAENLKRIEEAVKVAQAADIIILFVGENEALAREAWAKGHLGDVTSLELVGEQYKLAERLAALGKPMITCVNSGRPLALTKIEKMSNALLQCWYLGQETGYAINDVLFGKVNPSGRLSVSLPRSVGHLPCYYNYKNSARRGYLLDEVKPLYPFGYGLSYSTVKYSEPKVSKQISDLTEPVEVSLSVENTGKYEAEEIVQLYVRDDVASATRPVKELKRFKKVVLKPGEKQDVKFSLGKDAFEYYLKPDKAEVEPGYFTIMTGKNSEDLQSIKVLIK